MQVKNVQETEDKRLTFEGELGPQEAALVVSFGLNALFSMGLMNLIPNVLVEETEIPHGENLQ